MDVAIRAGTLTDSSLRARPLFTSYRKIVAAPDYLERHGTPATICDLKTHVCLGFTEPVTLNTWPVAVKMAVAGHCAGDDIEQRRDAQAAMPDR